MINDVFLVKIDDINNLEDTELYNLLEGQGFKNEIIRSHYDCSLIKIDIKNRTINLGYPLIAKAEQCLCNCIFNEKDFIEIYKIVAKYMSLPFVTYNYENMIIDEVGRRIDLSNEENQKNKIISDYFACSDNAAISIEIQNNDERDSYQYSIEIENIEEQGVDIEICFDESIDLGLISKTYLLVDDLIKGNMQENYSGIGWGRLEIMFTKSNNKSIDLNIYLAHKQEYDGTGDYVNFKLDEYCIGKFRDFLSVAYCQIKNN